MRSAKAASGELDAEHASLIKEESSEFSKSLTSEDEGKGVRSAKAASGELGAEHASLIKEESSEFSKIKSVWSRKNIEA